MTQQASPYPKILLIGIILIILQLGPLLGQPTPNGGVIGVVEATAIDILELVQTAAAAAVTQ